MNNFIYDIPTKVYFGENQLQHLAGELKKYGNKVLLTYGGGSIKKIGLYQQIIDRLNEANMEVFELSGIEPNPRVTTVNEGVKTCKEEHIDVLLAVGGGSTIDATKFIGAGYYYDGDAWDFFSGKAQITNSLPIVSVLTLSATGSEMDNCGVVTNLATQDKIGMGHPSMLPKVSFLDPTTTYSVSKYQTACGSADILSHIFECYFNTSNDLYMLDCVMEGLIKTVIKFTPVALQDPTNYEARANLMWASSWAINGFTKGGKVKAWSCHPMEHELSAYYDITHGLGLAILTPRWLEYCLDDNTVDKVYNFGVNVFDIDRNLDKMVVAKMAIEKLKEFLFVTCGLDDTLTKINIGTENFKVMATKACKNSSINGFKKLNAEDIENIYKMCL